MGACPFYNIVGVLIYSSFFSMFLLTRSIAATTDLSFSFDLTRLSADVTVVKCRPNKLPVSVRVSPCSRATNIPICLQSDTVPRLVPVDSSSVENPETLDTASSMDEGVIFFTNFIWWVGVDSIHLIMEQWGALVLHRGYRFY